MKARPVFDKTGCVLHSSRMNRPWISTNLAISADGKISSTSYLPSGWTSPKDKQRFIELRKNADAILVGRGTFENDRMTMTGPKNPLRCIISRTGKLDPTHPIFSTEGGAIHLLVTGGHIPQIPPGVTVHAGTLMEFLSALADLHDVKTLHCEGGGELIRELASSDLIDEFHVTLAGHTLFGGQQAPTATGIPQEFQPSTRHFRLSHFEAAPESGECFASYSRDRSP